MEPEARWIRLCKAEDIGIDTPHPYSIEGVAIVVYRLGDDYYTTADECTHGPGLMSEGYVEDGQVECPFHSGRFDIRTGAPTLAPCTVALKTWPTRIVDGWVQVETNTN